jgi:TonB-dependent receptor
MKFFSIACFALVFVVPCIGAKDTSQTKELPDSATSALETDSIKNSKDSMDATSSSTFTDTESSNSSTPSADTSQASLNSGTILGQILDGVTQTPLSGAIILVSGASSSASKTDKTGNFTIVSNTAGSCTLFVSFPGYIADTLFMKLNGAVTRLSPTSLWNATKNLGKSVVVGKSAGQANAYSKEKNSDNLKNVLDAELIEKLPDQSTADALQRVPGISIQRDQGEGKYVQIRGTESRLSTVTINGQSIASPDAQTRAVALNVIPADQLAEIEVSKVLTPDMDGDAIGGNVNLITSTAQDTNIKAKLNLTPGYTQLSNTPIYQGSASIGKCFLDQGKLGVFLGGSYYKDQKETQGIELDWDTSTYNPKGVGAAYLNTMQYRDYNKTNERIGANGRLDYHVTSQSNIFLVGSFNKYGIQQNRRTLGFDIQDQDARPMDDKDVVGEVPTTRSIKDTYKDQTISSATLGGTTKISDITFNGNFAFSHATSSEPSEMTVTFDRSSGSSYLFNHSNADRPTFEPIVIWDYQSNITSGKEVFNYDSSFNNMKYFTLSSAKIENTLATENSFSAQFDAKKPFDLDFGTLEAKAGGKVLDHFKSQDLSVITYKDTGKYRSPNLTSFVGGYSNNDFYNSLYAMNNMPDPGLVRAYLNAPHYYNNVVNPGNRFVADSTNPLSSDPETFSARDFNGAGYGMATLKMDRLTIIGGLRLEYTSMHYSGFSDSVNVSNNWIKTSTIHMYKNFFYPLPDLIFKYSPTKEVNYRASYTRSFSRPEWFDLVPHVVYNVDDNVHTVTKGNPDLRPTTADNFDLSGEYYFNNKKSILYAGVFGKQMHDYIFSAEQDTFFNQSKTQWTYYTKGNGRKANLGGMELELQSQFFFLPSFLSGFGINGNYIFTYSNTLLPELNVYSPLPGQSKHVGNAALFYEKYGFSGRMALNYQSHSIVELINSANHFGSVYVDDHLELDCAASQKFTKNVSAIIEFKNLTNAPKKLYLLDPSHTTQMEYYGWSMQAGVRLSF